jgi:hypothetical protein
MFGQKSQMYLTGPYALANLLGGYSALISLKEHFPPFLEDVPLNVREGMSFQHDGAPPHFSNQVYNSLKNHFPDTWTGRVAPIIWHVLLI